MNLESIQDLLFSIYESIDDLLCLNSKSVYNLRLPKNRNLGMIYKNLDFFTMQLCMETAAVSLELLVPQAWVGGIVFNSLRLSQRRTKVPGSSPDGGVKK